MPKINIVVEKELNEMSNEELGMYIKQLESENATLKQNHENEVNELKLQHQKEVEKLKTHNYNKFMQDTTIKSSHEVDSELDINEMVS